MSWFFKLIKVAGAAFPVSASLVQLQAELDADKFEARLKSLEDPISSLHKDISAVSDAIFKKFKEKDNVSLCFDEEFYIRYSRVLATLNAKRLISKSGAIGSQIPLAIKIIDPSFILYMANMFENTHKMQELFDIADRCEIGVSINAEEIGESIGLPKYLIRAVFEIYEAKGYGYRSGGIAKFRYTGKA